LGKGWETGEKAPGKEKRFVKKKRESSCKLWIWKKKHSKGKRDENTTFTIGQVRPKLNKKGYVFQKMPMKEDTREKKCGRLKVLQ